MIEILLAIATLIFWFAFSRAIFRACHAIIVMGCNADHGHGAAHAFRCPCPCHVGKAAK